MSPRSPAPPAAMTVRTKILSLFAILAIAAGFAFGATLTPPSGPLRAMVPLTELGSHRYQGFTGGLYPAGSNTAPPAHRAHGLAQAAAIRPLDAAGRPSPTGRIVFLSIGMSNAAWEFCGAERRCTPWSFMGRAAKDLAVDHRHLVVANGAAGGRSATAWDTAVDPSYDRVRDAVLAPLGLSEQQVQVVWLKTVNPAPSISLPAADADAAVLLRQLGDIVRALKVRYPNLRQVFLSSRIYGGYAISALSPEPYAYESGFAVKWLVQAQIQQMADGRVVDTSAGNLDWDTAAPWIDWGPYLWANGTMARADGLTWEREDLAADGVHPSKSGEAKVAMLLLTFFKTSPYTKCWFLTEGRCP